MKLHGVGHRAVADPDHETRSLAPEVGGTESCVGDRQGHAGQGELGRVGNPAERSRVVQVVFEGKLGNPKGRIRPAVGRERPEKRLSPERPGTHDADTRNRDPVHQESARTLRNARVALAPPKPKELESAYRMRVGRSACRTIRRPQSGSGVW